MYEVHPWIQLSRILALQSECSALSQVHRLSPPSYLVDRVFCTFSGDQHQGLIHQFYRLKQLGSIAEYVDQFDKTMNQLLAYDNDVDPIF